MKNKPKKRGRPYAGGRDPLRSVRIADDLWERARAAADAAGVSMAEILRAGLERELKRLRRASGD